jgi:HK97 family phage major capsid protein
MLTITEIQALRRKNQETWAKNDAVLKKAAAEKRDLTPEEKTAWDKVEQEYDARRLEIEEAEREHDRQQRHEARRQELDKLDTRLAGREGDPEAAKSQDRKAQERALRAFITQPPTNWDEETRALIAKNQQLVPQEARQLGHGFVLPGRRSYVFGSDAEKRALTAAANATVAEDFMRELDVALKSYSGMAQAARVVNTETGADMPFPTMDDTGNIGALLAEGSAAADTADPTLAAVTMQAFLYTSKIVRVPNQLLQDAAFSVDSFLPAALGVRLGRILNNHATLGTGSSQPRGLVTAILADTVELKAASATAIAFGDVVNLYHAVDPAYRTGDRVGFMMHDDILKVVEKIVDSNGRPIFRPANDSIGSVATIYNRPIYINQDMDNTVAEDKESIVFGDFNHYIIRRALNPVLMRLAERYAEFFQTGFVMFDRWDGDMVGGAGRALRLLSHNLV